MLTNRMASKHRFSNAFEEGIHNAWQQRWDSKPRYGCLSASFQDRGLQSRAQVSSRFSAPGLKTSLRASAPTDIQLMSAFGQFPIFTKWPRLGRKAVSLLWVTKMTYKRMVTQSNARARADVLTLAMVCRASSLVKLIELLLEVASCTVSHLALIEPIQHHQPRVQLNGAQRSP